MNIVQRLLLLAPLALGELDSACACERVAGGPVGKEVVKQNPERVCAVEIAVALSIGVNEYRRTRKLEQSRGSLPNIEKMHSHCLGN
jgi:hypothetical protein